MAMVKRGEYYDAHEVLEEVWFPRRKQRDDLTLALKGLINGCVALELIRRGKMERAQRVWRTFLKYENLMGGELQEAKRVVEECHGHLLS